MTNESRATSVPRSGRLLVLMLAVGFLSCGPCQPDSEAPLGDADPWPEATPDRYADDPFDRVDRQERRPPAEPELPPQRIEPVVPSLEPDARAESDRTAKAEPELRAPARSAADAASAAQSDVEAPPEVASAEPERDLLKEAIESLRRAASTPRQEAQAPAPKPRVELPPVGSRVAPVSAASMHTAPRKFARGLAGIGLAVLELPGSVLEESRDHGVVAGMTLGVATGAMRLILRPLVGLFELLTSPFELPANFAPIMNPEFTWEYFQSRHRNPPGLSYYLPEESRFYYGSRRPFLMARAGLRPPASLALPTRTVTPGDVWRAEQWVSGCSLSALERPEDWP